MAQDVLLKRSATPSKIPLITDLTLSELAYNTFDGKLYAKKDDGAESIVQYACLQNVNEYEKAQILKTDLYTPSAGTLTLDMYSGNNIQVDNNGGLTIGTPINVSAGQRGVLYVKQLVTSDVSWGTAWKLMDTSSVFFVTEDLDNLKVNDVNVYEYCIYSATIITYKHIGYFSE